MHIKFGAIITGDVEIAWYIRVFTAFVEDWFIPQYHMVAHKHPNPNSRESYILFQPLSTPETCMVYTHTHKQNTYIHKIKKKNTSLKYSLSESKYSTGGEREMSCSF